MTRIIKKILLTVIIALNGMPLAAQVPAASAILERDSLMLGDQVLLTLEVTVPENHLVSWPSYEDTLVNRIEIVEKTAVDTMATDIQGFKKLFQELLITGFDSGTYRVPSIQFFHGSKDDTMTMLVETRPFYIQVHTMDVDTSKAIKPIKPPLPAPYTLAELLPWILTGIGLILIGLLVFYYIKKRKSAEPVFKLRSKPRLPAHVIALNDLEELRMKKLWQDGKVKEYYTAMTDIVRNYIEERFGINAVEMTTEEIMNELRKTAIGDDLQRKLGSTLLLADLVKFARENPLPLDNDNSLNNSVLFVKETIPASAEEDEEQKEPDTAETEKAQS